MSIFTNLYVKPPKSSRINLSHDVSLTTDFGKLIPIYLEDVVPGDRFKISTEMQIKMLPTLAPVQTGIECRVDYFFVPNRLLWNSWEDFITGGVDGTDLPLSPTIHRNGGDLYSYFEIGSLADYFGLPVAVPAGIRGTSALTPDLNELKKISALPFRAYAMIWNEYYRDQNLQNELVISKNSGLDSTTPLVLQYRGLKKDYFTSALPWAQRGPQVDIPLTGSVPLEHDFEPGDNMKTTTNLGYRASDGSRLGANTSTSAAFTNFSDVSSEDVELTAALNQERKSFFHEHNIPIDQLADELVDKMRGDLTDVSAVTINELRRLNAVQRWLERNARAGSRYVEQILSHFGVRTPDYRLDRPEYLGGNKSVIGMGEIFQTSESNESPQGNRAGVGFGASLNRSRSFRCDEHGWIMGIMSIIPQRNVYADGIERKWTRSDKFDYFFPSFQFLGEQSIKNREIFGYAQDSYNPEGDFGYTPRYAEYRYHPSKVCGEMRGSMSYWHLGRLFNLAPALNGNFINSYQSLGQYDRIFPTDEQLGDRFIVQMRNHVYARRPMVKNPNPSL